MQTLTTEGRSQLEQIATRHGVGIDAAETLLHALERGGGTQAQFSHPDLGGMGQWSRGGMIMIGDMFNASLKTRVDRLCTEISDLVGDEAIFEKNDTSTKGDIESTSWWPRDCGRPSASGSQNDYRYAYFAETRRLAIQRNGTVTLYDTADHRISGVSQRQGASQDLAFTSQHGTVALHDLKRVGENSVEGTRPEPQKIKQNEGDRRESEDDIFAKIERLHALHVKGVISETDFADKKKDLLARI